MIGDIVPKDVAIVLRDKGFNDAVSYVYIGNGEVYSLKHGKRNSDSEDGWVSAPSIMEVLRWLRRCYNFHIYAGFYTHGYFYDITFVGEISKGECLIQSKEEFDTPEEALIEGIKYILEEEL